MGKPLTEADFETLLSSTSESAVHLELRDAYMADAAFTAWLDEGVVVDDPADDWWRSLIGTTVARGVDVRRVRVVSEPLSAYARWLWECTERVNLAAGERVRWLPRHMTAGLLVPPSDFWVFDSSVLVWNHFSGDGEWVDNEGSRDATLVELCANAFDAVWERAIDHREYRPT